MNNQTGDGFERELHELLPFFVNGTLTGDELKAVENYVESSQSARDEVAYLTQLRDGIKSQSQVNSPGELGLKRLQREISRSANVAPDQPANTNIPTERGPGVTVWWRNLAVAACLTLAVVGAFSMSDLTGNDSGMRMAGGENASVLQVTFKPDATEQVIRALLLEVGASITDGPSALGVYRLSLTGISDNAAIDAAVQKLRARSDLVDTAERQ